MVVSRAEGAPWAGQPHVLQLLGAPQGGERGGLVCKVVAAAHRSPALNHVQGVNRQNIIIKF